MFNIEDAFAAGLLCSCVISVGLPFGPIAYLRVVDPCSILI